MIKELKYQDKRISKGNLLCSIMKLQTNFWATNKGESLVYKTKKARTKFYHKYFTMKNEIFDIARENSLILN